MHQKVLPASKRGGAWQRAHNGGNIERSAEHSRTYRKEQAPEAPTQIAQPHLRALPEVVVAYLHHSRQEFGAAVKQPALTRVCKQLRNENLPIFYSTLSVQVLCYTAGSEKAYRNDVLGKWLLAIGAKNRYAFTCTYADWREATAERHANWLAQSGMVVEVVPVDSRVEWKRSIQFIFG
ncbi:hypothetical protein LTR37_008417 [Vermiconidia calcicola]|uniref:Uncharacterized protein n=1 Tax=Vermiconidia calcicola TaxID=1690605 RepID=A0ACC3NAN7_9PEZI|nr:hypothetical protein LTR37_008417 [Vermiconidia calcicola]